MNVIKFALISVLMLGSLEVASSYTPEEIAKMPAFKRNKLINEGKLKEAAGKVVAANRVSGSSSSSTTGGGRSQSPKPAARMSAEAKQASDYKLELQDIQQRVADLMPQLEAIIAKG